MCRIFYEIVPEAQQQDVFPDARESVDSQEIHEVNVLRIRTVDLRHRVLWACHDGARLAPDL